VVGSAFRLDARVAVVAGGASGLGAAISLGFAGAGASVVVLDIDGAHAADVAAQIGRAGGRATSAICDVRDARALHDVARGIVDELGSVDVLVNSAGTAYVGPAEDYPEEEFDRVVGLNLKGTFLSCQAFGRHMLRQGKGSIVNIASIGGLVGYPGAIAYLASKGGVVQLTRGLAVEWIGRVRVNAIAPTRFDTPLTRQASLRATVASEFIHGRFLREGLPHPGQIVGAAVFLACDASELVTGHVLPVDDGYLSA
jgi:NAD(P)-dependent dehydrogenase (short-subunit alcohol dehydrogenase family)